MKRISLAIALLALALAAASAQAQSPWSSLARKLAVEPRADAERVAGQVTAGNEAVLANPVAEVPNENPDQYANRLGAPTPGDEARNGGQVGLAIEKSNKGINIDLGRESEDSSSLLASKLFKNQEMRRLLGDSPRFIYDPGDKPDPMLVPWVRRAAIFTELMTRAEEMVKAGNIQGAIPLYQRIIDMRDRRFTPAVRARLDEINAEQLRESITGVSMTATVEERIVLPAWVKENTTGVIVTPDDAVCLVGDFMLRRGEPVPAYPEVKVATITPTVVTYLVQDEKFEVTLKRDELANAGK